MVHQCTTMSSEVVRCQFFKYMLYMVLCNLSSSAILKVLADIWPTILSSPAETPSGKRLFIFGSHVTHIWEMSGGIHRFLGRTAVRPIMNR